jgi:hypothetical protein
VQCLEPVTQAQRDLLAEILKISAELLAGYKVLGHANRPRTLRD